MNKIKAILFVLIVSSVEFAISQPNEQDCLGAISICNSIFSTTSALPGTGNVSGEINPSTSCLETGEKNDVWYTFSVQAGGVLCFTITPNFALDDYDWAVFNLTNDSCSDIFGNPSLEISCNYSADPGPTGPNGLGGPQNEACLQVFVGETYVINISQFSPSPNGYTIDFSNSTASIFDYITPVLQSVSTPIYCGQDTLLFVFSEDVLCNTVQDTDFFLLGPGGPYILSGLSSNVCDIGGTQDIAFRLNVSPAMQYGGEYQLCLDSNAAISDPCMNLVPTSCLPFTVTGLSVSSLSITDVNCFGDSSGSVTVFASGGIPPYSFLWNDPNTQTGATANGLIAGEYSVVATDASGCSGDSLFYISEPFVVLTKSDVSCDSATVIDTLADCNAIASVMPVGGTAPYTYQWFNDLYDSIPGAMYDTISGLCIGTWFVITTDSFDCKDTTKVIILGPQISDTTVQISCPGNSDGSLIATSVGGIPPYTYQWEQPLGAPIQGETDSILDSVSAGTYYLQVITGNSCNMVKNIVISDPIELGESFTAQASCYGACDGRSTVSPINGTPPYFYSWLDPDFQTTATATGLCPGVYTVYVTDSKGCGPDTLTITINENPQITLTSSIINQECNAINGSAFVFASGGILPYSYIWDNPSQSTTDSAIGLPAGVFSVIVSDSTLCSEIEIVSIGYTDSAQGMINITDTISCKGLSDGALFVSSLNGDTLPYQNWNTKETGSSIDSLSAGYYSVTAYDTNGCPVSLSILLNEPDSISSLSTFSSETSCNSNDGAISITPSGGTLPYSFIWSPIVSSTSSANSLTFGIYTIVVLDVNNCTPDTQQIELIEPPPLTILATATDVTCFEGSDGTAAGSILNGGTSPYFYEWNDLGSQTTAIATGLPLGVYVVSVTDINNCDTVFDSVSVSQPTEPIVVNLSNTCNDGGGTISSETSGGTPPYDYQWSNGAISSNLFGLSQGTYNVTISDVYNCTPDIGTTIVPNCFISIPTAFTPNGNKKNDTWEIANLSLIPKAKVTVYNRWGSIVFSSIGYEVPWDGRDELTNIILPSAVYYYIIEGVNPDFVESSSKLQGYVTLIQ